MKCHFTEIKDTRRRMTTKYISPRTVVGYKGTIKKKKNYQIFTRSDVARNVIKPYLNSRVFQIYLNSNEEDLF